MEKDGIFEAYITKYALTEGNKKREVSFINTGNMSVVSDIEIPHLNYHGEGKDWHKTYASALKRVKKLKQRKIDFLNKSIEKVKNITFSENEI